MEPTFPQALREIGLVHEQKGMFPQSIAVLQKSVGLPGNDFTPMSMADLGHVYAISGSEREARTMLSELHELSRKHYVSAFDIAVIDAGLGDKAEALAWLEEAYDDRSFSLVSLNVDPRFDHLRAGATVPCSCAAHRAARKTGSRLLTSKLKRVRIDPLSSFT